MPNWPFRTKSILLNCNTLVFASTQILLFILFPFFSEKFSITLSTIIASFTFGSALFLFGAPYWSSVSEKAGSQKIMNIGMAGLFISFALLTFLLMYSDKLTPFQIVIVLVFSRIIYGLFASAIVPVAQLMRSEMMKENQLEGMMSHSFILNLGRTLGPITLIFVSNIEGLFLAITALIFVLWVLNLKGNNVITSSLNSERQIDLKATIYEMKMPLILTIAFTTFTGILHSSLGGTLQFSLDIDAIEASSLMAKILLVGSFTMTLVQLLAKKLKTITWKTFLVIGVSSLFIGSLILSQLTHRTEARIAIIFISAGIALIQPSNLTFLHVSQSKLGLGKKIGILASGNTIGYASGGALASMFIANYVNQVATATVIVLIFISYLSLKGVHNEHH